MTERKQSPVKPPTEGGAAKESRVKPVAVRFPEPPDELWLFWNASTEDWMMSVDEAPGGATYLVALTKEEADVAAAYQSAMYYVECVPVCVRRDQQHCASDGRANSRPPA